MSRRRTIKNVFEQVPIYLSIYKTLQNSQTTQANMLLQPRVRILIALAIVVFVLLPLRVHVHARAVFASHDAAAAADDDDGDGTNNDNGNKGEVDSSNDILDSDSGTGSGPGSAQRRLLLNLNLNSNSENDNNNNKAAKTAMVTVKSEQETHSGYKYEYEYEYKYGNDEHRNGNGNGNRSGNRYTIHEPSEQICKGGGKQWAGVVDVSEGNSVFYCELCFFAPFFFLPKSLMLLTLSMHALPLCFSLMRPCLTLRLSRLSCFTLVALRCICGYFCCQNQSFVSFSGVCEL